MYSGCFHPGAQVHQKTFFNILIWAYVPSTYLSQKNGTLVNVDRVFVSISSMKISAEKPDDEAPMVRPIDLTLQFLVKDKICFSCTALESQ